MRSARALLLGGLAFALTFLGLAFLSGQAILILLPILAYWGAALLASPRDVRLSAVRKLSQNRAQVGAPIQVRLTIRNEGAGIAELRVHDLLPEGLALVDGKTSLVAALDRGETLVLEYAVQGNRGSYSFTKTSVRAGETFGLLQKEVSLAAPAGLTVLPDLRKLRRSVWIRPFKTHGYAGPIPARQGGAGIDFYGLRDYQMGDPRRRINWRVSARTAQALFTNEFEQERIADIGLILDAREHVYISNERGSLFEYAVQAAASLADAFLSAGNRLGLFVYGLYIQRTYPGYGKIQMERIRQSLAGAEVGHNFALEQLDHLPTRFFSPHAQLVLVSPLREEDAPVLVRLRARGYQLLVVSPDPVAYESKLTPANPDDQVGYRFARIERLLVMRDLARAGIQTVNWSVDQPFDQAMDRFSQRAFSGSYWAGVRP